MAMDEEKRGDVLILALEGAWMGGEEARPFQERIYAAIQEGTPKVVVDMHKVRWMNSAGLGVLMAALTTLRGSGGDLRLARLSERVRRPLTITRLDQIIRIFDALDEAVSSYEGE